MRSFLKFIITRHPYLTTALCAGLAFMAYLAIDFAAEAIYFNDPAHFEEDLKAWMTPRYVGMSWGLPRETIVEIFQLDETRDGRPQNLGEISARLGLTLAELQELVQAADDAQQADKRD